MRAYSALAAVGKRLYDSDGSLQRLPFNLYLKYGPRVRSSEALAMAIVAQYTTIPVPKMLDCLRGDRGVCILMTCLPGTAFGQDQTLYDLSPDQVHDFGDTLRDWFAQLRSIPVPSNAIISSIDGSPCRSYRISHDHDFGPFRSEDDLWDYRFHSVPRRHHPELRVKLDTLRSRPHRLVFSHGDVHPNNFLVKDGRLTGWIDWECAGWFPEYWDYGSALYLRAAYRPWCEIFTNIFPQYRPELEVEDAFWKVANPF
ncbi:hypothetical protein ONZ51_g3610 [Trametes cubensis]|uniref:Aminoglycoside phosphotransferase domain-containing protein n=1 Tax=Trametes cubensis TaxID=1111947 RepID=A0AAD7TXB6_9APHY|nr:hypothetical protein ONZ51_g3610 [Trametes cubensis]